MCRPSFLTWTCRRSNFASLVASPIANRRAGQLCFLPSRCRPNSTIPERCFPLTAADFARVNPNTGTAPIFRTRRDAELTTAIYDRLPVLVDRSSGDEVKAWPVKYSTMFHMTNDSGLFRTREELEEKEGAYPIGGNRYASPAKANGCRFMKAKWCRRSITGPRASSSTRKTSTGPRSP